MSKKYAEACDRNRDPILSVLRILLADCKSVLEIGSGTGQHAVYFAEHMPHLVWHTSDLLQNHEDIRQWIKESSLENLRLPLALDVTDKQWPILGVDAIFSANTAHIMSWNAVQAFFSGVGKLLPAGGIFALYGPFNYGNTYTSSSNAEFDGWLKRRDPESGIRNYEDLVSLAITNGMVLKEDHQMPVDNRLLIWGKQDHYEQVK